MVQGFGLLSGSKNEKSYLFMNYFLTFKVQANFFIENKTTGIIKKEGYKLPNEMNLLY